MALTPVIGSPAAAAATALVAWCALVQPGLGALRYGRLVVLLQEQPWRRRELYRLGVRRQWLLAGLALAVSVWGGVSPGELGLALPGSGGRTTGRVVTEVVAISLVTVVALRWQRYVWPDRALVDRLLSPVAALLPRTPGERRLFAIVALTAAATEEMVFRGFLLHWLTTVAPGLGPVGVVAAGAAVFGLAHAYQGAAGVAATAIMGLALGLLFLQTGSLLLPVVVHAVVDLRLLLLLPRAERDAATSSRGC